MTTRQSARQVLLEIYDRLMFHYGPQHWWPGDSPFEVIIGAILTQSTTWSNVEKAINNLKSIGVMSPEAIRRLPRDELARLIRSSGYYNAKAMKLKAFIEWLYDNYSGDLDKLFAVDANTLREQLLSVHGIGNETADSIILYAANQPVFAVDTYTKRIFSRVGLLSNGDSYAKYQKYSMDNLPSDIHLFNEYHALLVRLGKEACRKKPLCSRCCLSDICNYFNGLESTTV